MANFRYSNTTTTLQNTVPAVSSMGEASTSSKALFNSVERQRQSERATTRCKSTSPVNVSAKPLKSCLKKVSSYSDISDPLEDQEQPAPIMASPRVSRTSPTRQERRERRRMRKLRSLDSHSSTSELAPTKPRRCATRSSSCILERTVQHHVEAKPLKGILKKSSTDPNLSLPTIRKRVSWSSDLNRWNSGGSTGDLQAMINKGGTARKQSQTQNHKWDNKKSHSMGNLAQISASLDQKRSQAPGIPLRRGSSHNTTHATTTTTSSSSSSNPFQAAVSNFQTDYLAQAQQRQPLPKLPAPTLPPPTLPPTSLRYGVSLGKLPVFAKPPTRPVRQASVEVESKEQPHQSITIQ